MEGNLHGKTAASGQGGTFRESVASKQQHSPTTAVTQKRPTKHIIQMTSKTSGCGGFLCGRIWRVCPQALSR
eukprot:8702859-Pyramimonas_sp.AAC.2